MGWWFPAFMSRAVAEDGAVNRFCWPDLLSWLPRSPWLSRSGDSRTQTTGCVSVTDTSFIDM